MRALDLRGKANFRGFYDFRGIDLDFVHWDLMLYDCVVIWHEI